MIVHLADEVKPLIVIKPVGPDPVNLADGCIHLQCPQDVQRCSMPGMLILSQIRHCPELTSKEDMTRQFRCWVGCVSFLVP